MKLITKPSIADVPEFFNYFLDLVVHNDLLKALAINKHAFLDLVQLVSKEKENYKYAEGKWSTKQVLQHIIDCERIYNYRAFRFSRCDSTELAGFDEELALSKIDSKTLDLKQIEREFLDVRASTISLFNGMSPDMLDFKGKANNTDLTARSLGFMAVGHCHHHLQVIKERYLNFT